MKKILVMGMVMMMAVTVAACGKKSEAQPTETEQAETQQTESGAAGGDTASVESSEAVGESVLGATVQKVDGNKMTVELGDGQSMSFDISHAELSKAWELMPGDEVDIGYDGEDPADGMAVKSVVVSVPFELMSEDFNENTSLYGLIEAVDEKSVTVRELLDERTEEGQQAVDAGYLGETYTFARAAFETVVTKDGVKQGAFAQISYLGELGKDALSFRICTEDMEEDAASDVISIKGTVEKVEDGIIYLKGDESHLFKFATGGSDELLHEADALSGKEVLVNFSDSLRQRVATADSIAEA